MVRYLRRICGFCYTGSGEEKPADFVAIRVATCEVMDLCEDCEKLFTEAGGWDVTPLPEDEKVIEK